MGLPVISVEFKKLASTAVNRSIRGILAVIVQDDTVTSFDYKTYTTLEDVVATDYTDENYTALSRAFLAGPYQVIVVRIGTTKTMDDAKAILDKLSPNWLCAVPEALQSGVVSYVKSVNTTRRIRKVKALVTGQEDVDDIHVVNVANTAVTIQGDSSTTTMALYLPRLGGVLAACPMDESVTYKALDDLVSAEPVEDVDDAIDAGNLVLFADDDAVRIARGVNTLQTLTGDLTEDMKKIAVVEAMDLIQEDIIRTFKAYYLGKRKNTADNQALFVSDILTYLTSLSEQDVISRDDPITVEIDVDAMREAWEGIGTDTSALSDAQVKKKTFRSSVFVRAQAHILDAMEDLYMIFTMA